MENIGNLFSLTRESAGVSLKEVSEDLNLDEAVIVNIEAGKTGAFSDVFTLKNYVYNYAKYLGLDAEKIIDEFNEYVFESTSKIPVKEIEKKISKENTNEKKVVSPYTHKEKKMSNTLYTLLIILFVLVFIVAVFWSVKQITVGSSVANSINIRK